jgi:hypothetical protein
MLRRIILAVLFVLPAVSGCTPDRPLWHDEVLPSGRSIKVTSFMLVWGVEHDERDAGKDCLSLEFVSSNPAADAAGKEREALEAFELIRPASELWAMRSAEVSAYASLDHRGPHDIFVFTRAADGRWTSTVQAVEGIRR